MGFFDAMIGNLSSDWYILLFFLLTLGTLCVTGQATYRLHRSMNPSERMANPQKEKKRYPETPKEVKEFENFVVRQRSAMNLWYSLFANSVSIFPLLGMFGTVKALIGLAGRMSEAGADVELFFQALTSTAWGIIFAVLFKIADAVLSVPVAANNKEVDTLLERNSTDMTPEKELVHEA